MRLNFSPEIRSLLALIREELRPGQALFLLGGAVRDALLGRKIHDLDFAMGENPTATARRVANRLGAGFFVLDDDRHTARVLYHNSEGKRSPIDFVQFTGDGLLADLENRDFTINAMAVSLHDPSQVIDPLRGRSDLEGGLIRACSDHALLDDPVRVLRGVRLALQFRFTYASDLERMMVEAAAHLPQTSYERQRDEFFRILEGPDPALGMADCRRFDVFKTLIPGLMDLETVPASPPHVLPLFDHTLHVVAYYDNLLASLRDRAEAPGESPCWLGQARAELSQYAEQIRTYFEEEVTPGRSKRGLVLMGALLHDIGKPLTMEVGEDGRMHYYGHDRVGADLTWDSAKRLKLSNAESDWISTLVRYHMRLLPMVNREEPPTRREIYRFYQKAGEVGVAIALHVLADTLATYEATLPVSKWSQAVLVAKEMLSAWWEHKEEMISPQLFLNGDDLQSIFGLAPGKQIGGLLGKLAEAQASGEVTTEEEAVAYIRGRLPKKQEKDRQG